MNDEFHTGCCSHVKNSLFVMPCRFVYCVWFISITVASTVVYCSKNNLYLCGNKGANDGEGLELVKLQKKFKCRITIS
jgi:hypothetical protein